jgi:hypothetical protein
MPIVHFRGRIFPYDPKAFFVNFKDIPTLNWKDGQTGESTQITTRIDASIIDLEFDVKTFDERNLAGLAKIAWDVARVAVDLWSFKTGWGLGVVIDSIVTPDGRSATLLSKDESLGVLATALDSSDPKVNNFDVCYRIVATEPALFMALNDLIVSITLPHHATVNCARAVERLRAIMAPNVDRKQAWPLFQGNLNIDRTYREYVTNISTGPRHGDPAFVPGTIVTEVTKRSWMIMNRFLEYRKRANKPLPLAEFPLLR